MADLHFDIKTLSPEEASFSYDTTRIEQCRASSFHGEIIGQPRAVQALEMGLSIPGKGYNIFVSGEPGTGRMTAIRMILKKQTLTGKLKDILYINNFSRPDTPILVLLPSGKGLDFQQSMKELVRRIKEELIKQLGETEESSGKTSKINIEPDLLIQNLKEDFQEILDNFSDQVITEYIHGIEKDLKEFSYIFSGADADTIRSAQFFLRYSVNLLVDNSCTTTAPMIYENHPTFSTLFGSIDDKADSRDDNYPPFLSIHGGSFLEASGGYLILNMVDILKEDGLWDHIKRSIKTGMVIMQNSSGSNQRSPGGIRPEPIPFDLKIIALGNEELYDFLFVEDEDFYKLFKVNAEFDFSMPSTDENIGNYVGFIKMIIDDEQLSPIETSGIAELLRYGSYMVEQRDELSTQFSLIADILRESHYWAKTLKSKTLTGEIIKHTLKERDYLANLPESKIIDQILSGEMLLHLKGSRLGNVNALAVLDRGTYSFGIPAVISATVAPGTEGIVNIEHEAGLSGEIHDKGLLILEGYLRKMYARKFPLSIYSGICFEQSYAEVDGDSASSSELYALLSSIGNIPIRQDIAVTGSVNQMGEIQPVGGINEKITGFFSICSRSGLTGKQGVIIPKLNIRNLLLPDYIIDAIKERKFSIYPVENIDEGMQVLASRPAGIRNSKGSFPPNTMNRIIEDKLKKLYEISRQQN
jgi:lon-related putative ATP-dependent protease